MGQGLLIIEASRSHSDTPHSVGFLWTSDQPVADTSTWQHTTLTRERYPCSRRNSYPQSQQASGRRHTPWTPTATEICSRWNYWMKMWCRYNHQWGFFLWCCDPTRVMASSFLRFLDHTQRHTTVGRTPLDEWSARRRDLYLITHNTHNRQTSMPPVGFEPTISAGERPQTYALNRAATGTDNPQWLHRA